MRIAITGSASFIGKTLCRQCEKRGIEWHGLDLAENGADICASNFASLLPNGLDAIVHLAAVSRDGDCRSNPARAIEVNIGGTQNVIDAAREKGIRQIVFASSEWVYGDGTATVDESTPIDAGGIRGEYALTKVAGERLLAIACGRGDLHGTALRFGIVYGRRPDNWSAVETLHHAVETRDCVEVGSLRTARRFIHVEDIARGILAAIGREGFEVFNLTGSDLISLGEIIAESARLTGRAPQVTERTPGTASIRDISNARATVALGWHPQIGLRAGLESLSR